MSIQPTPMRIDKVLVDGEIIAAVGAMANSTTGLNDKFGVIVQPEGDVRTFAKHFDRAGYFFDTHDPLVTPCFMSTDVNGSSRGKILFMFFGSPFRTERKDRAYVFLKENLR